MADALVACGKVEDCTFGEVATGQAIRSGTSGGTKDAGRGKHEETTEMTLLQFILSAFRSPEPPQPRMSCTGFDLVDGVLVPRDVIMIDKETEL